MENQTNHRLFLLCFQLNWSRNGTIFSFERLQKRMFMKYFRLGSSFNGSFLFASKWTNFVWTPIFFLSSSSPFPRNGIFFSLSFFSFDLTMLRLNKKKNTYTSSHIERTNEKRNKAHHEMMMRKKYQARNIQKYGRTNKATRMLILTENRMQCTAKGEPERESNSRIDRLAMEKTCCCRFYCISVGVAWSHSKDCSTLKSFICSTKPNEHTSKRPTNE